MDRTAELSRTALERRCLRRSARRVVWAARNTRSTACRTPGPERRVGYLPYTDTVSEIKVETAGFDASKGHTSGASISMLTKSGTNRFHGSGTWQYWNQDWNATQSTTNAAYYGRIEQAIAEGRTEDAERYCATSGRFRRAVTTTTPACSAGPVRLPGIFNGPNKLFFFFSYNGFKDVKVEEPTAVNRTVPTEAQRRGDFSDLLRIDPVRYQIYDPRTARLVNGRVVRDPFPNNQVPVLNPLYQHYVQSVSRCRTIPLGIVDSRRPQQLSGVRDAIQLGLQRLQQPLRLEHLGSPSHVRAVELEQVRRRSRRLDVRDRARPAYQRARPQEPRGHDRSRVPAERQRPSGTCRWPTTASPKAIR